ncbi:hypothetical protein [Streptomyces sp. NPDC048438]|uniref:glycosyltransferase n=1 Tax=Streptomyces sp. NPDC048438 TaxID=3365551 RepID=UPI0037152F20
MSCAICTAQSTVGVVEELPDLDLRRIAKPLGVTAVASPATAPVPGIAFPRLAAVVHHAGADTSAAALRVGVPAVTIPVTAGQPFWAMRLAALGAPPTRYPSGPSPGTACRLA